MISEQTVVTSAITVVVTAIKTIVVTAVITAVVTAALSVAQLTGLDMSSSRVTNLQASVHVHERRVDMSLISQILCKVGQRVMEELKTHES